MKRFSLRRIIFPLCLLALPGAFPGAAIPAFAGLTYTCDPNIDATQAGTCAYLNSTIAGLYNSTFSNANANIYIMYGSTGLGQSDQGYDNQVTWTAYLAALTANAQASGNPVQIAAVKALTSLDVAQYGNGMVDLPSALVNALGLSSEVTQLGNLGITGPGGTFCMTPGSAACYNGIITITNQPGVLYYRTGGSEGRNQYDFYSTVEHETDELLGTASCVETTNPAGLADECPGTNTPAAIDLFRYQSAGNLVLIGTAPGAYFSYNGGQTNGANGNLYNTLDNGDDYADFVATCQSKPSIQDAEVCAGTDGGLDITNDGGAEINILNAVGYKLNPQPVAPPVITSVTNGATFQSTMAANMYVTIKGTGLSTTSPGRQWAGPDFTQNADGTTSLPTSLDGTSVTVNGTPAYVEYISPTQVNIVTPAIAATGNGIQVVVSLNGQLSTAASINLQNLAPSFFAYFPGTANDGKYLVGYHAANPTVDVGPAGLYASAPNFTTPAQPGETVVLFGTGFGSTSPPIVPGIVTNTTYNLSPTPKAMLGGIQATVGFGGLIAGFAEVYQFNVVIPSNAPNGDLPLIVTVNGTESYSGLIAVQAP
jgi:uncharacterized protein (TIGR03437 family)